MLSKVKIVPGGDDLTRVPFVACSAEIGDFKLSKVKIVSAGAGDLKLVPLVA